MRHWKTDEIEKLLAADDCTIERGAQASEKCSRTLTIIPSGLSIDDGEFLDVLGFVTDDYSKPKPVLHEIGDPDDCQVEMVEVSDGQDSGGGLASSNPKLGALYGRIVPALRQAGFNVVHKMDDYF